ncbi:MAG: DUF229 domain-containing protein [Ruminococcaceae bacterium]|nr:DUF229 domain-containing protein [Oscillospiraceae bacterium]
MKRIIALLLAVVLGALVFVSCDNNDAPAETDPIETSAPEETVDTKGTRPADPEPEIVPPVNTADLYLEDGNATYDRVVIIGVDGAGAFFKGADTPVLDEIFAKGAVTYTMQASTPSISAQSWGSLFHGVIPEIHRLTNEKAEAEPFDPNSDIPSFFRVVREAFPDAELASFCTWNTINIGIIEDNLGVTEDTADNDADLTEKVVSYLDANDPKLLFVHFDDVDGAGHEYAYGNGHHIAQIEKSDEYIGQIFNKLEEKGLLKNTLFIVTSDHGGTGKTHGGDNDREMNIMFAVAGKTVVEGGEPESINEEGKLDDMQIRDTAAVVLQAFGLSIPEGWTSVVPDNIFEGVTATTARKVTDIPILNPHRFHESVATPLPTDGNYITDVLGEDRVEAYITFDGVFTGDVVDAMGNNVSEVGELFFTEGYYGNAFQTDNGCVVVDDYRPGKDSFSVAFWFKTTGTDGDPCLIANKDWNSGSNPGFLLSLREGDIKFNLGDGENRMDQEFLLPVDYANGWIYVVLSVDREAGKVYFSYDFDEFEVIDITDDLKDCSFDGINGLVIGQDGTTEYDALPAQIDDVLIVNGALTQEDVALLAGYYGVEK